MVVFKSESLSLMMISQLVINFYLTFIDQHVPVMDQYEPSMIYTKYAFTSMILCTLTITCDVKGTRQSLESLSGSLT